MSDYGLTEEEIADLESRGYEISSVLGKGTTGTVFRARKRSGENGEIVQEKALKIERDVDPSESATAYINRHKKDLGRAEIEAGNQITHPGIAQVEDSFRIGQKQRRVIVKRDVRGTDLETLVKMGGALSGDKVVPLIKQFADRLHYLHETAHLIHRDIKPNNLIITDKGDVVLIDLQNAAQYPKRGFSSATESLEAISTRGGARHMPAETLNSLCTREVWISTTPLIDINGFGTTIYRAVTGKDMFDYQIRLDPEGTPVTISDSETIGISLYDDGRKIDRIDYKEREKVINQKLRGLPKRLRELIRRSVTGKADGFRNMREVEEYIKKNFDDSKLTQLLDAGSDVMRVVKTAAITATAGTIFGIGALLGIIGDAKMNSKPNSVYTTAEAPLNRYDVRRFKLEKVEDIDRAEVLETLVPRMIKLGDAYQTAARNSSEEPFGGDDLEMSIRFSGEVHLVNRRLISAVYKTGNYYGNTFEDDYKNEGITRKSPSYVPLDFIKEKGEWIKNTERIDDRSLNAFGTMYLKQLIDPNADLSVADIYARYYLGEEALRKAIASTGGIHYFPRHTPKGDLIDEGYRAALPQYQRELIETATSFYLLSDEEGKFQDYTYSYKDELRRLKEND